MLNKVLWAFGRVVVFSFVYFLGRFNFSIGWLAPMILTSIQDYFHHKRSIQKAITQTALQMNERDTISLRLDEIPAWVLFPDFERAEWINKMLKHLWPRINHIVWKIVKDFEPILQDNNILRTFKFVKIDLGKVTPRITGIKVYDNDLLSLDEMMIDVNICYFGDCEISFSLNGIEGGIKDIEAEGELRIVLKPVINEIPLVSAIQFYFLKHPKTNFEFTTALASLDLFATRELIRSIIKDQISLLMVYPNKIHIKLDPTISSSRFEMPKISGIMSVEILSVENVEEGEIISSIELGANIQKSPIVHVKNDVAKFNFSSIFIAFEDDKEIYISVDKMEDNQNEIENIGKLSLNLQIVKEKGKIVDDFQLEPKGILSANIEWMSPSLDKKNFDRNLNLAVLQIFIESGRNLSEKHEPFVEIFIHNDIQQTQHSHVINEVAIWKKHFNIFIRNPNSDVLTCKLKCQKTNSDLGFYSYKINDLFLRKSLEHELQAFPLTSSSNFEIIMALKLNLFQ